MNRLSDTALQQKTKKSWQEWLNILNAAGAAQLTHQQIVAYLSSQHHLDSWWAQMITVGYEQYHGRRERYQKSNGYEISVSKTISVTLSMLYDAWVNEKARKKWLPESVTIRTATLNKSIRITWTDETTHLTVNFYPKGEHKSQVVVQHSKISDLPLAEEKKYFWKITLDKLCESLIRTV